MIAQWIGVEDREHTQFNFDMATESHLRVRRLICFSKINSWEMFVVANGYPNPSILSEKYHYSSEK